MKILSLLSVCALALFSNACEKHPLAGDPAPGVHAEHSAEAQGGEKHEAHPSSGSPSSSSTSGETHDAKAHEATKPAEGAKTEESPKFFPEKK